MNEASPVVKLIALAIVGGVAKSLFGPPVQITNYTQAAEKLVDAVKSS